ncbi:lysophospholipase L1-like esterase [Mucilaginibacter frigoritolerans]|uniref:Lysophospholipase L1-like esterase n=1 Tax=Mucilaginibacter frigoritolerans TaxID=652788 RepID=A0A562TMQ2_9SPHI|nr:GDSL-type esterase/lipase family protein [Mucilaginibacter frigoritolerans]TWI94845.1 lysophospholipase L1-like esterase [Mucilaginibacter frigoritolerans]
MKIKLLILFLGISFTTSLHAQQGFPFDNEIKAFKHQDSIGFSLKNGILFIGSSSIRKWTDLEQRFAGKPVIKRGVGGCTLEQLVDYYTPYILFPYHPQKVFIYAGENDIAAGKSGQFVFEEFKKLWVMINKQLPGASIYFMSIKLSPSRAQYFGEVEKANSQIKSYLVNKPNSTFIDVGTAILKPNSTDPDPSLFQPDMLHLNSKGYDRWQQVLEPYVN